MDTSRFYLVPPVAATQPQPSQAAAGHFRFTGINLKLDIPFFVCLFLPTGVAAGGQACLLGWQLPPCAMPVNPPLGSELVSYHWLGIA